MSSSFPSSSQPSNIFLDPDNPTPAPSAQSGMSVDADQTNFMAEVVEASQTVPVVVDFWAPWCGPCKQLTPQLEALARAAAGRFKLVKVDVDANPALTTQLGQLGLPLQSIPLVVAFWKGQMLDLFQGVKPESFLRRFVEGLLKQTGQGMPAKELLRAASDAIKEGRVAEAVDLYTQILENEPGNPAAWAGLIRAMLALGDLDSAQDAAMQVPPSLTNHADIISARTALALHQEGQKAASELETIRQALITSPADPSLRLKLACALNGAGQREEAAEALLALIREDQTWNDGAAKKELLRFFEAWGMTDPLTLRTRRALSSLLFS